MQTARAKTLLTDIIPSVVDKQIPATQIMETLSWYPWMNSPVAPATSPDCSHR